MAIFNGIVNRHPYPYSDVQTPMAYLVTPPSGICVKGINMLNRAFILHRTNYQHPVNHRPDALKPMASTGVQEAPPSSAMSDSRYAAHGHVPSSQYQSNQAYAASNLSNTYADRSQRPPGSYAHGQANYAASYPTAPFPAPQRSMTPSVPTHSQNVYPQGIPRHRAQSISAGHATPSGHYGTNQSPSVLDHQRVHSHMQTPLGAAYLPEQPHNPSSGYLQGSSTPTPNPTEYYYSNIQDMQSSTTPQRPFPCDMCALSFNRQHDLKRHRDTHSGERPFLCNGGCGKTFTRKDALKRHQLVKNCGRTDD